MSEAQAPRVWIAGNPEPSDVRLRVRDKHGDIWTPEQVLGGVRAWSTPETALATWDYLAKKWGPLTEVTATSLGVSGEDRPEPTPAPREPRVWRHGVHTDIDQDVNAVVGTTTGRRWKRMPDKQFVWTSSGCAYSAGTVLYVEHEVSEVVSPEGTS